MRRKENEPPAGGRQNLRKPMPKGTRYAGETCLASDLKGRYEEHMRKQRAVLADIVQQAIDDRMDQAAGRQVRAAEGARQGGPARQVCGHLTEPGGGTAKSLHDATIRAKRISLGSIDAS